MIPLKNFLSAVATSAIALAAVPSMADEIVIQPSPNGEVVLVVDFDVLPGKAEVFEQAFRRAVTCSRLEPGNVVFNLHRALGPERSYVLYEIWRDQTALESHFARPYTQALFPILDRALVRPLSAGGLRFVAELVPQRRAEPATTDPSSVAECR